MIPNFESVDFDSSKPIYIQIAADIEKKILNKEIAVGQKIPPQEELRKIFKVSKDTITESISTLMKDGYLANRRTRGTFVISSEPRKGLDLKRKNEIGVVIGLHLTDPDPIVPNTNTRYNSMLTGLDRSLKEKGLHMIYTTVDGDSRLPLLDKSKDLAGLILAGAITPQIYRMIEKTGIPFVMIGDVFEWEKKELEADVIADDDSRGMYLAAKHLIELGHKRIAFVTFDLKYQWKRDELEGYKQALAESNISYDQDLVIITDGYAPEKAYEAVRKAVEKPVSFTALIGSEESLYIGALNFLRDRNLKVPGDVSVVCKGMLPDATAVMHDMDSAGKKALERLLERINDPGWKPERIVMPPKLIVRKTTGKI